MKQRYVVSWLPMSLHLAHALVAFSVAYLLSYLTLIWNHAAPGSLESVIAALLWAAGAIFEVSFVVYFVLRRRKIRRLWADATIATRDSEFATARVLAAQLLTYWEYTLNPAPAFFVMAIASEGLGESREAAILYRRCGDYPPALFNLGVLMLERGANDRAAEALRRFIARTPADLGSVVLLSVALYRSGKVETAMGVLKKRQVERPNSPLLKRNIERLQRGEEPSLGLDAPASEHNKPAPSRDPANDLP